MNDLNSNQIGFLNIYIGGVGTEAGNHLHRLHAADASPYQVVSVHIDTDPSTRSVADFSISLKITAQDVAAMRGNPDRFSPAAAPIIRELADLLRPGDIQNGARTVRAITQLSWIFHRPRIIRQFREAVDRLKRSRRVKHILLFMFSSSGGGTGSAGQILMMKEFSDPAFVEQLLLGYDATDVFLPGMSLVVEPFSYARTVQAHQARKIVANAYAFRLESDWILRLARPVNFILHLGYSNHSGTVLSDPRLMGRVLGTSGYEIQRNWPELKARWVDGADSIAMRTFYSGQDGPERIYRRVGHTFHERNST